MNETKSDGAVGRCSVKAHASSREREAQGAVPNLGVSEDSESEPACSSAAEKRVAEQNELAPFDVVERCAILQIIQKARRSPHDLNPLPSKPSFPEEFAGAMHRQP